MRLADYVADVVAAVSPRVYGVCGGGAMYLNDALAHHPGIRFIATHHEQAATFAAEADARVSNELRVVSVTSGPGVTNAVTGVACAYADSVPMLVIAGQAETKTMRTARGPRQIGISEVDGPSIMKSITKYAATVYSPVEIRLCLERAIREATTGRKGPAYIEIPLDIQSADILDVSKLRGLPPERAIPDQSFDRVAAVIERASRPVILFGHGVRLAGGSVEKLLAIGIPVLCSWSGADLVSSSHPNYIGRPGLIGDRAGNLAIMNADVILAIGARLSIPQIGHWPDMFAPKATLIMVDTDPEEISKRTLTVDIPVACDAKKFLDGFDVHRQPAWAPWLAQCQSWRDQYPVIAEHLVSANGINAYHFVKALSEQIDRDAVIVTDVGTAFVATMQSMPMSGAQRMFHSPGIAPMGYGLPAAIGAAMSGRQTICLTGDGGTMFNLQELQTIVHHKLPIKIFYYDNRGYKTMQTTQGNHFARETTASPGDGISWPDFWAIAAAFGIETPPLDPHNLGNIPDLHAQRPMIYIMEMDPDQRIAPIVKTKMNGAKFAPTSIEHMFPEL